MSTRLRLDIHLLLRPLHWRRGVVPAAVAAAALAWGPPPPAHASGDTTSITLQGASLTFSTSPAAADFPTTSLTGSQQTVHTTFGNWGVTDATGTGAGWHVTFQATQLTGTSAAHPTLPSGSLKLTGPVVSPNGVNVSVPPVVQCTPNCTLDSGSAVAVVHALASTGQGAWTMSQANTGGGDLVLTVPASATADTYSSTLTFTLATGP